MNYYKPVSAVTGLRELMQLQCSREINDDGKYSGWGRLYIAWWSWTNSEIAATSSLRKRRKYAVMIHYKPLFFWSLTRRALVTGGHLNQSGCGRHREVMTKFRPTQLCMTLRQ